MDLAAGLRRRDDTGEKFDALITALYRTMLLREPEDGAIPHWRGQLVSSEGLEPVINQFLRSGEFRATLPRIVDFYRHDTAPSQHIESEIDGDDLALLWKHVEKTWSRLGDQEPYFSVLTDPRYQSKSMSQKGEIETFYSTGEGDLRRLETWLSRNGLSIKSDGVCVEYGCGVGRCTEWLARRFGRVVAIDISVNHLNIASERAETQGIKNIEHVRVKQKEDLLKLKGADFFYSVIVLQHNPPPVISQILEMAFSGLNKGGVAYFQVPTFGADGYSFRSQEYINNLNNDWMEMHALPQSAVFRLAHRHGLRPLEVSPDHCTGGVGVSTTFLLQKD